MKITTGIDVIDVDRIKQVIQESSDTFVQKVFTQDEIEYCNNAKAHKYESFAARFAAKEAVFKALDVQLDDNYVGWKDIEVINGQTGRPKVELNGMFKKYYDNILNIDISLSHEKHIAIASVSILWKD